MKKFTDAEIDDYIRLRQECRMPGNSRLVAKRNLELFVAAVKRDKRKKRKRRVSR